MPITKQQAQMLTSLAVDCRPPHASRWDEPGIMAALAKVSTLALADIILATIRAASDATAKTPAVISATTSTHWREKLADPNATRYHPPKRSEDCPRHPGQYADRCGGCAADAATHTPAPPQQHHVNPDAERAHRGAAAARAALRAATTVQEDS